MNWKKILSGFLTSAFIFGVSVNTNAASLNDVKDAKQTYDKTKDKAQDIKDGKVFDKNDKNKPPEPPKDSDGNPMPPPDKKDFDKAKNKYDNAKKDYNRFKNATR